MEPQKITEGVAFWFPRPSGLVATVGDVAIYAKREVATVSTPRCVEHVRYVYGIAVARAGQWLWVNSSRFLPSSWDVFPSSAYSVLHFQSYAQLIASLGELEGGEDFDVVLGYRRLGAPVAIVFDVKPELYARLYGVKVCERGNRYIVVTTGDTCPHLSSKTLLEYLLLRRAVKRRWLC
ncbi:MAG: hypothetical protein ACPL3C_06930 [Pyrobaculum sp.]